MLTGRITRVCMSIKTTVMERLVPSTLPLPAAIPTHVRWEI